MMVLRYVLIVPLVRHLNICNFNSEITHQMNYKITFSEMNKLAMKANLKKPKLSLEDMKKQVSQVMKGYNSKMKKGQFFNEN